MYRRLGTFGASAIHPWYLPRLQGRHAARTKVRSQDRRLPKWPVQSGILQAGTAANANPVGGQVAFAPVFLGFMFRARKALGRGGRPFACFLPATSPKALKAISRSIRRWSLHHHSDKSLQDSRPLAGRQPFRRRKRRRRVTGSPPDGER